MKGAFISERMSFDKQSVKAAGAKGVWENPALLDIIERRHRARERNQAAVGERNDG